MDKSLKRKRETVNTEEESDEEEPSTSAQQVTVKFGKAGEKKTRETFKSLQEKSDAEPWTECQWHKDKSTLSEVIILNVPKRIIGRILDYSLF